MDKEKLEKIISTTKDENVKRMAQAELQKLELQAQAAGGDELSKVLLALKETVDTYKRTPQTGGAGVSKDEVERMVREALQKGKIAYEDMDEELKARLSGSVKVALSLSTPMGTSMVKSDTMMSQFERPLFQKVLSDWKARNNVYLFGGAGTGKTYLAQMIAEFLGYEYIELNCNQFTSPLDILGGQTIDGYQAGKLEMAWGNTDEKGNPTAGAVLCLDELPKIDPNTAGILNSALAKVKDFKDGKAPIIRNGKGETIEMKNIFIIATGNTKLNETSVEYEANFKQDLSLQDRFAGSTYEVVVDYENEFNSIMKGYAFIWIYMTKLREKIIENKWTGFAFVSIRIMQSMRDTYKVYRDIQSQKVSKDLTLSAPKTLKQSLDSFLNLFTATQIETLKRQTDYDEFLSLVRQKDSIKTGIYDTQAEVREAQNMIESNRQMIARKTA